MKKKYYLLLFYLLIFFSLSSCKKDQEHTTTILSEKESTVTVEEARSWIAENKPALNLENNWDYAKQVISEKNNEVLKVKFRDLLDNRTWILTDILFQKDQKGKIDASVYKVFVDTIYFSKKKRRINLWRKKEIILITMISRGKLWSIALAQRVQLKEESSKMEL
ncbi:hypothetical protein [Pedobacter sp. WC2423]|uniref:hypothetical protein n=1 Tax=Pedobacter sp. WC2423 TaxID=3234142 RepID=UPI003466CF80